MSQEQKTKKATLKSIVNDILAEKDDVSSVESFTTDLSLTDNLGLDSLDLAELTVRLEDEYGVDVFEDDVVDGVGEVLEKLDS